MPGTHEPISMPQWASELCDLLDPIASSEDVAKRVAQGSIKPLDSLQYELGISPTELASRSSDINKLINRARGSAHAQYVTTAQLYACKTVVDLMNLVFSCIDRT